jgi:hypothetical protein
VDGSRDSILKFPHMPGPEIAVPAGTTLRDIDGRPISTINVAETPLHLAQAHLQHLPPAWGRAPS